MDIHVQSYKTDINKKSEIWELKCQSLELNSNVRKYNTRRKMDIHVQSYKTDINKESVINMGTKECNKYGN